MSVATSVLHDGTQRDLSSNTAVSTPSEMKRCNTKATCVTEEGCRDRQLRWNGSKDKGNQWQVFTWPSNKSALIPTRIWCVGAIQFNAKQWFTITSARPYPISTVTCLPIGCRYIRDWWTAAAPSWFLLNLEKLPPMYHRGPVRAYSSVLPSSGSPGLFVRLDNRCQHLFIVKWWRVFFLWRVWSVSLLV